MRSSDNPNFYHGETVVTRIPATVQARVRDLSNTFGQSQSYWLDRIFGIGYMADLDLQGRLARNQRDASL